MNSVISGGPIHHWCMILGSLALAPRVYVPSNEGGIVLTGAEHRDRKGQGAVDGLVLTHNASWGISAQSKQTLRLHVDINKMYTNKYMVIKIHYCEKFITGQCNIYK